MADAEAAEGEEEEVIEDTSELGEDDEDVAEVIENADGRGALRRGANRPSYAGAGIFRLHEGPGRPITSAAGPGGPIRPQSMGP